VVDGLDIIERLQRKYACVVTNPPYMGAKGMNDSLSKYAAKAYPDSKSDLFALFIEKIIMMVHTNGLIGLMTPFTWMFLSSYEKLRNHIHNCSTITSLIRPEYHAFFDSAYVPICSFTLFKKSNKNYQGVFIDLQKFYGAGMQPIKTLEAINNPNCGWLYQASSEDFAKIPGSPIVYWVSTKIIKIIGDTTKIGDVVEARQGLATADNNRFLRLWWEIPLKNCYHNAVSRVSAKNSERRWFPYNKGGVFRKWYGNHEFLVDWEDDGKRLNEFKPRAVIRNPNYYFLESISWSDVTIGTNSFRYYPSGFIFDSTGHSAFPNKEATKEQLLSLLNNKLTNFLIGVLNPTMHFHVGYFNSLPYAKLNNLGIESLINSCIDFTKFDWDSYETSWDFTELPIISGQWLVASDQRDKRDQSAKHSLLQNAYQHLREHWQQIIDETKRLEEENNRIFIEAYGLQEELTPEVPIQEITLTCNPAYRYGAGKTEEEYATLQKADTVRELLSYCAGVLFGRYSLDKPGLILANQGECTNDCITKVYGENVPPPSDALLPDEDAIIPILDEDYFGDDIFNRTKQILAKAFSPETLAENIKFIEDALGKDLRKFYTKDFYNDHIKRYKKRPIYWMFASPKGTFRTLIYMHRYRPDTLSQMLSNYLRPLIEKLKEEQVMCNREMVSETAAAADKTRSQKRLDKLVPQIEELTEYEQVLYRLAAKRIEIDLDDGVRVNYPKFAPAIVTIKGMEVEE
jgi:hypothetical protein